MEEFVSCCEAVNMEEFVSCCVCVCARAAAAAAGEGAPLRAVSVGTAAGWR